MILKPFGENASNPAFEHCYNFKCIVERIVKKGRKEQHLPVSCLQTAMECRESREIRKKRGFQSALWLSSAVERDSTFNERHIVD